MIRLLATARDAGAARHIVEIVHVARTASDLSVRFVAADAAARSMKQTGEAFEPFSISSPYERDLPATCEAEIEAEVERLFDAMQPDVVLSGLATFRGGIDDAAIMVASRRGIPAILLLDDVGHPQSLRDLRASDVFAVNDGIGKWARKVFASKVHVIGSPRHYSFASAPVDRMRAETRLELGLPAGRKLVTFFAQSGDMPGHHENFNALTEELLRSSQNAVDFHFLVRSHPGFPATGRDCVARATARGLHASLDVDSNPAALLVASDVILSCVSSVIGDYVWLARASENMQAYLAYLLMGDELKQFLESQFGSWRPELGRVGLARMITERTELSGLLQDALSSQAAIGSSFRHLSLPEPSPMTLALETVRTIGSRRAQLKRVHA